MSTAASTAEPIVEEITIAASAERIFEALTDPQQRLKWWGAEGQYRATHMESDLRAGGQWSTRGTSLGVVRKQVNRVWSDFVSGSDSLGSREGISFWSD